ncbi:amino acid ABC transporter substrate-binding protein [Methylobacterium sp. J-030]|uniref:amino acid ABC transporter substrate-binding protein n=1 Tax=Methylobacterium sp. J-030 TaxID=2836627 RepID=UPI001FB97722|nr:amino acid ABC transporter substrate-binding protein [Methylobacterium sp. J-030]MCJ2070918.1 amino acid ABC transporter substrate-binding protein [Methylobacterium sp. J-030]
MSRKSWLILSAILLLGTHAAGAEELTGTLKKVKDSGEIAIGYRDASIPFSYLDGDQKPVGFAMDICYRITDAVKAELKLPKLAVKLVPVTASTRIPLMANGTIDLECGSTTNNADRQKQVWFTNTHFLTATRFASKKSAQIDKIDDLKGKTVVSIPGSTNILQTLEVNTARNLGMTVLQAKDHGEAWLMVENGRAAAYIMDDVLLASLIASSKEPGAYRISSDALSRPEPYGIMVRKDDPAFKKVADAATAKLYTSPEGKVLYDKWFTKPIPPRGINLNFPMNAAMSKTMMHPSDSPDPAMY